MTLWFILILMTMVALAAIALPFALGGEKVPSGSDVAIYKDQHLEIDRDQEAGLIGAADAAAARIEVSRRLLNATDVSDLPHRLPVAGGIMRIRRLAVLVSVLMFLPTLAGGLYLRLGSPGIASAGTIADQTASASDEAAVDAMVAEVEGYLKGKPNDGRGWEALAPVYMHMGRYEDSVQAWRNAIAGLGDSADREENLGESLVAAANGVVTDEAKVAFDRALSIDRGSVTARFYIGLAAKQAGRRDEAARTWRDLLAAAPPDADWIDTVRDALAQLDEPPVAATDDSSSSATQQGAMIKSMVEGLSQRLRTSGGDPADWLRLVRSYNVLGERDKADAAIADARRAFASDPDKLAQLKRGLKEAEQPLASVPREGPGQPTSTVAAPPEHDNATIQAMVDKLAERLRKSGGDVDSWLMLVRSYETLGERNKAMAAIAQARLAFASDPEKLSHLDQVLRATDGPSNATSTPETLGTNARRPRPTPQDASSSDQQMAMIKGMVDRLAERLKQDGHDVDGWIQLMRSYVVLGQRDQASAAGQNARIALGNDAEALRRLNAGAKEIGVDLP
jgi:cytochrome c-type biogenesis protein CcmH